MQDAETDSVHLAAPGSSKDFRADGALSTSAPSAHTPGPWEAYGYDGHGGFCIQTPLYQIGYASWAGGAQEANARLIAAAPDLLEALRAVAALPGFEKSEPYAALVLAAIAKATSNTDSASGSPARQGAEPEGQGAAS